MEKNTVLLDIDEYNSLRDLRTALFEGKTVGIYGGWITKDIVPQLYFYTDDEVVKEIADSNKDLRDRNKDLKDIISRYEHQIDALVNRNTELLRTVADIKKMSVRQFKRWRGANLSF